MINLEGLIDFNLESLLDVIPAGIVNDAKDITVDESSFEQGKLKQLRLVADLDGGNSDMSARP